jgi:hypothetical protein
MNYGRIMKCRKLEEGRNHGSPSVICRLNGGDWCPRTKGGAAKIGPECWDMDYDQECKNRFTSLDKE